MSNSRKTPASARPSYLKVRRFPPHPCFNCDTPGRKRWSTHKKSSETSSTKVENPKKSSLHSQKVPSKEKRKSSTDTVNSVGRNASPKRRNRSKSRDHSRKRSKSRERQHRRSRSKDRNGGAGSTSSSSHKKNKKHCHSPDSRDYKWKNDKCDNNNSRSSSDKKQTKRDRSRS